MLWTIVRLTARTVRVYLVNNLEREITAYIADNTLGGGGIFAANCGSGRSEFQDDIKMGDKDSIMLEWKYTEGNAARPAVFRTPATQ